MTGIAELLVFHPVDTIAKRLMSNKSKVRLHASLRWHYIGLRSLTCSPLARARASVQVSASTLSSIIFKEYAGAPLGRKLLSLFPGLGYAAGYKVTQRIYKYGGQPWFSDILGRNYRESFTNTFGERKGKMMMQATAGRCVVRVRCSLRWLLG